MWCVHVHVGVVLFLQDAMTLCTLGIGTAFGESILNDTPRHATVVTSEFCELLRVEQKDFKILWGVSDLLLPNNEGELYKNILTE